MTILVKKTITVAAPQAIAFDVFTNRVETWWPLESHHIGKSKPVAAIMELHAGGRWYERGEDGSECDWGRVLLVEPPSRIVLRWQISSSWGFDPTVDTEVDVRFFAEGDHTRVELEHRKLEAYGDAAEQMRSAFDTKGGWGDILERFAAATTRA